MTTWTVQTPTTQVQVKIVSLGVLNQKMSRHMPHIMQIAFIDFRYKAGKSSVKCSIFQRANGKKDWDNLQFQLTHVIVKPTEVSVNAFVS